MKVGKTTRLPSDRAQELSGTTGVPTPFIVAFEQLFDDCDGAEAFVHARLEQMELRQSANREFFSASAAAVIRVVLETPGSVSEQLPSSSHSGPPDVLDDMVLTNAGGRTPWDGLLQEATEYEQGLNGKLEDLAEAYKLYKQAARLGCGEAYERLGEMHQFGNGAPEDAAASLEFYKSAVRLKRGLSFAKMATIFAKDLHKANYAKCAQNLVGVWERNGGESIELPEFEYDIGLELIMHAADIYFKGEYPIISTLRSRASKLIDFNERQLRLMESQDFEFKDKLMSETRQRIVWLEAQLTEDQARDCAPA